jgi:hypothetical protein
MDNYFQDISISKCIISINYDKESMSVKQYQIQYKWQDISVVFELT